MVRAVEEFRAFLLRDRKWRWVLAAIAVILVGQAIEKAKIDLLGLPRQGELLTLGLYNRLHLTSFNAIDTYYGRASSGRHGIGYCGPTEAPPPPAAAKPPADGMPSLALSPFARPSPLIEDRKAFDPLFAPRPGPTTTTEDLLRALDPSRASLAPTPTPTPSPSPSRPFAFNITGTTVTTVTRAETYGPPDYKPRCSGWFSTLDRAVLTLRVTPEVAGAIWSTGNFNRLLFVATILGMIGGLILLWSNLENAGLAVVILTMLLIGFGPTIMGIVFWLLLQLLLGLILLVGKVLAGISLLIGATAGSVKFAMAVIDALTKSDDIERNTKLAKATIDDLTKR